MAAAPKISKSRGLSFWEHRSRLPFVADQSKNNTSSKPESELQIRRPNSLSIPDESASRRRDLNVPRDETTARIRFSIAGDAVTAAAALSRSTVRRWSNTDLFRTRYSV